MSDFLFLLENTAIHDTSLQKSILQATNEEILLHCGWIPLLLSF